MSAPDITVYGAYWCPDCHRSKSFLGAHGFIVTGHDLVHADGAPALQHERAILETSVPGVFAAGDVRAHSTKQVASAAGEGAAATIMIREFLKGV